MRQIKSDQIIFGDLEKIADTVAMYYNLPVIELQAKSRSRSRVYPRQIAMALARSLTNRSYPEIGEAFGNRDHTTVIHGEKAVRSRIESDVQVAKDWHELHEQLEGEL